MACGRQRSASFVGQYDLKRGSPHVNRIKNGIKSVHPIGGNELRALRKLQREEAGEPLRVRERARGSAQPGRSAPAWPPRCGSAYIRSCSGIPEATSPPTKVTTRAPYNSTCSMRISRTRSATCSSRSAGLGRLERLDQAAGARTKAYGRGFRKVGGRGGTLFLTASRKRLFLFDGESERMHRDLSGHVRGALHPFVVRT
jgi:hypothetical protein